MNIRKLRFTDLNSLSDTCYLKLNRAFITCLSLWKINDCFDADDDDDDDELMIIIIIISCSGEWLRAKAKCSEVSEK